MPTSTARYRFEFRILEFAESLSRGLNGTRLATFVGVRGDGNVRRVYFAPAGDSFEGDRKNKLVEGHESWMLYTPGVEGGSGYLEWMGLQRHIVERWIGSPLVPDDFIDVRAPGKREEWPVTWRVWLG